MAAGSCVMWLVPHVQFWSLVRKETIGGAARQPPAFYYSLLFVSRLVYSAHYHGGYSPIRNDYICLLILNMIIYIYIFFYI